MPSARMAPDGELSVSALYGKESQRYNFDFQVLPWLEVGFRYSGLPHLDPLFPVYWDRSFALKARLWNEGEYLPAVAVGVNDVIGTGIYGGEYVVATKQFGNVDVSLGLGWGRMSSNDSFRNPLAAIFPSFENRPLPGTEMAETTPGGAHFNTFFHGPRVGIFGGVAWKTPVEGLTLLGEYSSDKYVLETIRGNFKPGMQFNFGANYQFADSVQIGAHWLYGRTVVGTLSFTMDPVHEAFPERLPPGPPPATVRTPEEQYAALQRIATPNAFASGANPQAATAWVDDLWRGNATGITDIAMQGRDISISISGNGATALDICRLSSGVLQQHAVPFDSLQVVSAGSATHCVGTSSQAFAMSAALVTAAASPKIMTIDARGSRDETAIAKFRTDSAAQGLPISAVSFSGFEAVVYYSNYRYLAEDDAINRLLRLLMSDAPPRIEKFRLISTMNGVPGRQVEALRAPLERDILRDGTLDLSSLARPDSIAAVTASPAPMQNPILNAALRGTYPDLSWSIFPQLRQELFDPNNPLGVQILAAARGSLSLAPGLSISGQAELSLFDTFNTGRVSDSLLPHVRTDFLEYFSKGKNGINDLSAEYRFRLAPSLYVMARAGYLESMFAGGGGEILWRPEGQRWALGIDGYEVWQRNFDRLFGLQPYHVFTGHISAYYASPWYGLNFVVRAGQYLAGDRGVTFQVTRRFASGVEVGAFMTKTNVSASQFGEGSFDKGIIIKIPMNWTLPIHSQNQLYTIIRPTQRDGGQQLLADAPLYEITQRSSTAAFALAYGE